MYSVLNPINVNSILTGTSKRERRTVEGDGIIWAKQNRIQEMYLSGLLEALCINNVNPREERQVSIGETYIL